MRTRSLVGVLTACLLAAGALSATAQEQGGVFGGFEHDSSAPIEITSNALEVHQAEHLAIFTGDVVAGQGTLRLTADRIEVSYAEPDKGSGENAGPGTIRKLTATGSVFISNGSQTAKGERARYDIASGIITMTGDVVLTQGNNVISGKRLVIDLGKGTGRVEGRVKSIFRPEGEGAGSQNTGDQDTGSQDTGGK